jgi:hypothetical protein
MKFRIIVTMVICSLLVGMTNEAGAQEDPDYFAPYCETTSVQSARFVAGDGPTAWVSVPVGDEFIVTVTHLADYESHPTDKIQAGENVYVEFDDGTVTALSPDLPDDVIELIDIPLGTYERGSKTQWRVVHGNTPADSANSVLAMVTVVGCTGSPPSTTTTVPVITTTTRPHIDTTTSTPVVTTTIPTPPEDECPPGGLACTGSSSTAIAYLALLLASAGVILVTIGVKVGKRTT